ncbi:hypothetical protein AWB68_01399 [Caballeronia choica]|uniref:Uncharacterized protein n=2 Tax=Caballeronia choica TaxID=326476 RepID=A0A158G8T9_9BURK|nr:hypothetical protein AWB68_01399 [Caballeronia choica]
MRRDQIQIEPIALVAYTTFKRSSAQVNPNPTKAFQSAQPLPVSPVPGDTMKLTFAIAVVAMVLVAGTTTICMSGAVTARNTEYGGIHATVEQFFNPDFSQTLKACR